MLEVRANKEAAGLGSSFLDSFGREIKKANFLWLIALFFKAYAVEADIRLLAFYLHLPDQDPERRGSLCLGWTRKDSTRGLNSWSGVFYKTRLSLRSGTQRELKKKSFSSFGWLLALSIGRLSACVPKWRPFFGNGYTKAREIEFDLSLYAGSWTPFSFRIPFRHEILYWAWCGITIITHSLLVWLLV